MLARQARSHGRTGRAARAAGRLRGGKGVLGTDFTTRPRLVRALSRTNPKFLPHPRAGGPPREVGRPRRHPAVQRKGAIWPGTRPTPPASAGVRNLAGGRPVRPRRRAVTYLRGHRRATASCLPNDGPLLPVLWIVHRNAAFSSNNDLTPACGSQAASRPQGP